MSNDPSGFHTEVGDGPERSSFARALFVMVTLEGMPVAAGPAAGEEPNEVNALPVPSWSPLAAADGFFQRRQIPVGSVPAGSLFHEELYHTQVSLAGREIAVGDGLAGIIKTAVPSGETRTAPALSKSHQSSGPFTNASSTSAIGIFA